jgi:hypothetical protein
MTISKNVYTCRKWVALHGFVLLLEHVFSNIVNVISLSVIWIQWGLYVSPHCFFGICVCSNEHLHKLDSTVYCLVVVMFFGDSGLRRAEITDGCSSRMDPLHDRIYQCFCCYVLHGQWRMFYHFLFQNRQIPTVLLRCAIGYIFVSRTCSYLFPQSFWLLCIFPPVNPAEAVGFFRAKKSSACLPSEGK